MDQNLVIPTLYFSIVKSRYRSKFNSSYFIFYKITQNILIPKPFVKLILEDYEKYDIFNINKVTKEGFNDQILRFDSSQ